MKEKREAKIFILNGNATCGKDTFAEFVGREVRTYHYSIVTPIKEIIEASAGMMGIDTSIKDEKMRKLISDIKLAYEDYNDSPYRNVVDFIEKVKDRCDCIFVDMREKHNVEKLKTAYGAKVILIENNRIRQITSNIADANIYQCPHDILIENNGTLEDLRCTAQKFARSLL